MSKGTGKTIQIFLPDGDPRSIRIAWFTDGTVQVFVAPRKKLDLVYARVELKGVGLYFLVGDGGEMSLPSLYVGEAENCSRRLKRHEQIRDGWTTAIVCISRVGDFTKAHVKYLEKLCFEWASVAGRYTLEQNSPTSPHVPEPLIADLMGNFGVIRTLVSTLGFPIFDKIEKPQVDETLYCKGKKARATGAFGEGVVVVFEGSVANRIDAKASDDSLVKKRRELLDEGVLEVVDDETLRFAKDHVFPSPSQAAAVVLARNANGWTEWKYPDGRTLDEVKRQIKE